MAWRKINDTKLTAIADAIRGKTGKTAALTLDAMPTEIAGIETGPSVSGEIAITEDGTYDVSSYSTANVDVVSLGTRSITANGTYDVTKYASANVNVQSAPVLLWTNASPTSNFAAQTVGVASGYEAYLIKFPDLIVLVNAGDTATIMGALNTGAYISSAGFRRVTASTNGVTFTDATVYPSGSAYNNSIIPTHIYGVKFTL